MAMTKERGREADQRYRNVSNMPAPRPAILAACSVTAPTASRLCKFPLFDAGRIVIRREVEPDATIEKGLEAGEQWRKPCVQSVLTRSRWLSRDSACERLPLRR